MPTMSARPLKRPRSPRSTAARSSPAKRASEADDRPLAHPNAGGAGAPAFAHDERRNDHGENYLARLPDHGPTSGVARGEPPQTQGAHRLVDTNRSQVTTSTGLFRSRRRIAFV